ncbi:kinesin-related protein 12-like [Argopecten irradians]|uniref:kinesin-related protein 12-like n=1 Tax=Argopecten irradians TaxID=31199 RepID=UPI003710023C
MEKITKYLLLLCLPYCFGNRDASQLENEIQPLQCDNNGIMASVNQKMEEIEELLKEKEERMERLLKERDVEMERILLTKEEETKRLLKERDDRIGKLESDLLNQNVRLAHVTRDMTSLKRNIVRKNTYVNGLVRKISELENVMNGGIPTARGSNNANSNIDTSSGLTDIPGVPQFSSSDVKSNISRGAVKDGNHEELLVNPSRQKRVVPSTASPQTPVAFHTTITTKAFTPDDTVVFDKETLDQGNGYNPGDGIYTVPETGTYVFTWTVICDRHGFIQTVLVANGVVRGSSWTEATDVNDLHQTTAVVVLPLNQGDHVFIRMGHTYGTGHIVTDSTLGVSTFSGWKLV